MAQIVTATHGDAPAVARLAEAVAAQNPGYELTAGTWDGPGEIGSTRGARYVWLIDGEGEVLLPGGQRTQEGDGLALPATYLPDPLSTATLGRLDGLRAALAAGEIHPLLGAPVAGLCERQEGGAFRGDAAGDIWLLLESDLSPAEWSPGSAARDALAWLVSNYQTLGWATKERDSWETVLAGDQLVVTPERPLDARGTFRFWSLQDTLGEPAATTGCRRLRYLRDTAGGCSPGFDAFRRLPLTWHLSPVVRERVHAQLGGSHSQAGQNGRVGQRDHSGRYGHNTDAPNRVNSHVLHIEAAQSRTHYHPVEPIGGGRAQSEFYFVVDPRPYSLHAPPGSEPRLTTFGNVEDWRSFSVTPLTSGLAAFIPPGTGHRGTDAFVNVVTIPGFKPRNEIYVDGLICRATGGTAPHNETAGAASASGVASRA